MTSETGQKKTKKSAIDLREQSHFNTFQTSMSQKQKPYMQNKNSNLL